MFSLTHTSSKVSIGFYSFIRGGATLLFCLFFLFQVNSQVLINEVITDPQIDWSTNSFDGTDGLGTIDSNDEWLELLVTSDGVNLTGWTIEMNDGTNASGTIAAGGAFVTANYLSGTGGTSTDTDTGDYLILGQPNGSSMDATITVILRDNTSAIIDQVEIAGGSGTLFTGASTGISDEAVFRTPSGTDTDNDAADFRKGLASLGAVNGLIYVDATATDDLGLGRISDPKQLIQSGIDLAVDDGTVIVAAGTYSENIAISNPVSLQGANVGIEGNGTRGAESIIEPSARSAAIEIDSDDVTIDGMQIGISNVDAGIHSTADTDLAIQNNVINADSLGVAIVGATTGAVTISSNQITLADFTTPLGNVTSSLTLYGLSGSIDVDVSDNEHAGSALGVFVYGCLSSNILSIANDTVTASIRGASIFSTDGTNRASSTVDISGFSVSSFSEPGGGITNFPETGIYFFTDGSSTDSHIITATVTNSTFEDVENTTSDYAGIICGDFSSTDYVAYLQDITITECNIQDNENRGLFARGQNTQVNIIRSTLDGNGFNPTATGGNPGISVIARNNAEVTITNSILINPASLSGSEDIPGNYYTAGLFVDAGGSIDISGSSIINNGNGFIATGVATNTLNMSANWLGSADQATVELLIQNQAEVDFTPYLGDGTDTDLVTAGFQGAFDDLVVTTTGSQTSSTRLQEVHDLADPDATITVRQDDYAEALTISKNISLNPEASTTIDDLTLNGGNLTVLADLEINNTLTLTDGVLDIDLDDGDKSDDPVLTLNATVSGTGSTTNHIEGKMELPVGAATLTSFPVGDEGGYHPVELTPTNATTFLVSHVAETAPVGGGTFGDMSALEGTASSQLTGNIESTLSSRFWDIDIVTGSPGDTDVTLEITGNEAATDPTTLGMLRFDGTDWLEMTRVGATGSDPFTITGRTNTFSSFAIYSTDADANPLPVELMDFVARVDDQDIELSWKTLTEINSDFFEIERGLDGVAFEPIGSVSANGDSNEMISYSFLDRNVGLDMCYYRLKMVDVDGSFEYSPTLQVIPDLSDRRIRVYPNPTVDYIRIDGIAADLIKTIDLYDLNGRLQTRLTKISSDPIEIDGVATGQYILQMILVDGSVFRGKLIVD